MGHCTDSGRVVALTAEVYDGLLRSGQPFTFPVRGNSMRPLFRDGDSALVQRDRHSIRVGDIVVYRSREQLFAHRVLRVAGEGRHYVCKGDAREVCDRRVLAQAVLGRVVARIRDGRQVRLDSAFYALLNPLLALISPYTSPAYRIAAIVSYAWGALGRRMRRWTHGPGGSA